ncbi:RNA polymerase sigma factor SigZ [uncultured Shewanella sp.]|uniref:RNA polymerase sigma factor SigZ n=1 Tax=uncultured Shewanella sp. TaxID=173975 RepID=UPI0026105FB5|nr:RNA polymerase sigma factor SigZ [uncultured Shewanella sp.]
MTLEKIWNEYRLNLKAFLHTKIANEADVEDVLQDILIKTHQHLHTVRTETSVKAWLFQIARNAISDHYRRHSKITQIALDEWLTVSDKGDDIHPLSVHSNKADMNEQVKQELIHCIEPFVHGLSTESRQLLIAIELNGMSQKAYATSHGIAYSTLKSRVKKARTQLRKVFDDCCYMQLDRRGQLMDYEVKEGKN